MNLFQKYGIKEVADVVFYSIDEIGDEQVYTPVLYLDSLKVSTLEQTAEKSEAKGGLGNKKLITWNYGKEITLSLEDALFTPASMSLFWGGKLDNHLSPYMSAALKCNLANQYLQNHYSTKAYPSPSLTDEEWELVYQAATDVNFTTGNSSSTDGIPDTRMFYLDDESKISNNTNNVNKWQEKLRSAYYNRNTCFPLPHFTSSNDEGKADNQATNTMSQAFGLNILPYISSTNTLSSFVSQTSLNSPDTGYKAALSIGNYDFMNSVSELNSISNTITTKIHEMVIDDKYINYLHKNMKNIALNVNIGDPFYFSLNDFLKDGSETNNNYSIYVDYDHLQDYANELLDYVVNNEIIEDQSINTFVPLLVSNVQKALCNLYYATTDASKETTITKSNFTSPDKYKTGCTIKISNQRPYINLGYAFNKENNSISLSNGATQIVDTYSNSGSYWQINEYLQSIALTQDGQCLFEKILFIILFGYDVAVTIYNNNLWRKEIFKRILKVYLNHKLDSLESSSNDYFMTNILAQDNDTDPFSVRSVVYKRYAIFKLIRENLNDIVNKWHTYFTTECFIPMGIEARAVKLTDGTTADRYKFYQGTSNTLIAGITQAFIKKYLGDYCSSDDNSNVQDLSIYTTHVSTSSATYCSIKKPSDQSTIRGINLQSTNENDYGTKQTLEALFVTSTPAMPIIDKLIYQSISEDDFYQYNQYYQINGTQYEYGSLSVFQAAIPVKCFYTTNLTNTRYSEENPYDYHNSFDVYLLVTFSPIVKNRQMTGVRPFLNSINECYQVRLVNKSDEMTTLFANAFNPKSKDKNFYLCPSPEKVYSALTSAIDTFDDNIYSNVKSWGKYISDTQWDTDVLSEDAVLNQINSQTQEYSYYAMSPYIIQRLIQNIRTESDYTKVETSNDMILDVIDRMEKCVVTKRGGLKINRRDQERNILRYYTDDKSSSYEIYYDVKTMTPLFHYYSASENVDFYRDTLIPAEQAYNQDQGLGTYNNSKTLIQKMQGNSKEQGTTKYYIDQEHDEFVLPVGSVYYKWTRTVVNNQYVPSDYTLGEQTLGERIVINPDTFPEKYKIVGNTYIRNQKTGKDECYQFTIHRASIGVDTNITLEAEGDPTVFDMSVDVLCPPNNVMMELKQYSVIEDKEKGGTKVVPYGTQRSKTYTKIDDMVESINLENNEIY